MYSGSSADAEADVRAPAARAASTANARIELRLMGSSLLCAWGVWRASHAGPVWRFPRPAVGTIPNGSVLHARTDSSLSSDGRRAPPRARSHLRRLQAAPPLSPWKRLARARELGRIRPRHARQALYLDVSNSRDRRHVRPFERVRTRRPRGEHDRAHVEARLARGGERQQRVVD